MASTNDGKIKLENLTVCNGCCCYMDGISCTTPECCGCLCDGVYCCYKINCHCCKMLDSTQNEDGKCCNLLSGGSFCVKPRSCCESHQQYCCYDSRCALPCTKTAPCIFTICPFFTLFANFKLKPQILGTVADLLKDWNANDGGIAGEVDFASGQEAKKDKDLSDVNVENLILCEACLCCMSSCYCDFPHCCGFKGEQLCCCLQCEAAGCKPVTAENDDGICCIISEGGAWCVKPTTCCYVSEQFFCMDIRAAFPTVKEKVPCACTLLPFCAVYPRFGCCAKIGTLTNDGKVADHAQLS